MTRTRVLILAAVMATAPITGAIAQERGASWRQEQAREESRGGQRIDLTEVVRRVSSSRPGRFLGVNERGGGDRLVYVVRWEYPGGRIADISVDGRSGRIIGER